jgi:hypothetical protein
VAAVTNIERFMTAFSLRGRRVLAPAFSHRGEAGRRRRPTRASSLSNAP